MREQRPGPVDPTESARTVLRPLPLGDAPITNGLWAERQRVNRETTIPVGAQQLEAAGSFENFKAAAAGQHGTYHGRVFQDGEVYKWLEALAWEQARERGPSVRRLAARGHRPDPGRAGTRRLPQHLRTGHRERG